MYRGGQQVSRATPELDLTSAATSNLLCLFGPLPGSTSTSTKCLTGRWGLLLTIGKLDASSMVRDIQQQQQQQQQHKHNRCPAATAQVSRQMANHLISVMGKKHDCHNQGTANYPVSGLLDIKERRRFCEIVPNIRGRPASQSGHELWEY